MFPATLGHRTRRIFLWVGRGLTLLLTLFLLMDAGMKLAMLDVVVTESAKVGVPQDAIFGLGVTLLVATLLFAVPSTTVLGAILLTGYFGGAIFAHLRQDNGWFPLLFAAGFGGLVWLSVWLRECRLWQLLPVRAAIEASSKSP
jgi:hypothetical protein